MDENGDHKYTRGEAYSETDSLGGYEFQPNNYDAAASAHLVVLTRNESRTGTAKECVDAFTGQPPGVRILEAPSGSKVLSPMTTLISEVIRLYSGDVDMTVAEATTMINTAFGLDKNADHTQIDPIYATSNGEIGVYGEVIGTINMIANLVSSVGTLLFGMSSMYGGRLNENDCEMKVYSGIAREVNEALLVASRAGNRKLLTTHLLDLSNSDSIFGIAKSSLYSASLTNIQLRSTTYSPDALNATVSLSVNSGTAIKNSLSDLTNPTNLIKEVTAASKVAQDPVVLKSILNSATGSATDADIATLDGVRDPASYAAKATNETDTIAVTIPLYPPPPSPPPPGFPPPYVSKGPVLNSAELSATIAVPTVFVLIVVAVLTYRHVANKRRARRLARYESRIEREVLAAQKSVKKLSVDRVKSELAALKDEKAAERKLIKKYEKHMQKSKEKVEKAIALRIQAEKQRKKEKAAEKAALE